MMRARFISLILCALVVGSASAFVPHAFAQQEIPVAPLVNPGDAQGAVQQQAAAQPLAAPATCQGGGCGSGANGDLTSVFGPVMGTIMSLFAWLMGEAGVLLNETAYYTVVRMGSIVGNSGLSAIGVVWHVMRDLGNLVLIFGFLAVGISTIVGSNWYGGGKKMIPTLLIAAVFLNFSLFVAEAVIDVGNLFATQVYTQINGGNLPDPSKFNPVNDGISNTIMNDIGLQTLYNVNGGNFDFNFKTFLTGFLGILLFIVAAFVMFSISFILVARFVFLIFLIIAAPIGFAAIAIPKLNKIAEMWWNKLIEQAFTAPVLLFTLYIALAVITDTHFLGSFGLTEASVTTGYQSFGQGSSPAQLASASGILLSFLVGMGLLMACVIVAKQMSAFGASWATKLGGRATFGAVAWAGRSTLGATSYRTAQRLRTTSFARTGIGRTVVGALDRGGKASFDVRSTSLLKDMKIDAGKAHKGGFEKMEKESVESREKYAKSLKETATEKAAREAAERALKDEEESGATKEQLKLLRGTVDGLKNAPQKDYANRLQENAFMSNLTHGPGAKKAAEAIKKNAGKSKEETEVDTLKDLLKKAGENGGGGGEKKEEEH